MSQSAVDLDDEPVILVPRVMVPSPPLVRHLLAGAGWQAVSSFHITDVEQLGTALGTRVDVAEHLREEVAVPGCASGRQLLPQLGGRHELLLNCPRNDGQRIGCASD
jgi:hypothetical protein